MGVIGTFAPHHSYRSYLHAHNLVICWPPQRTGAAHKPGRILKAWKPGPAPQKRRKSKESTRPPPFKRPNSQSFPCFPYSSTTPAQYGCRYGEIHSPLAPLGFGQHGLADQHCPAQRQHPPSGTPPPDTVLALFNAAETIMRDETDLVVDI